MRTEMRPWTEVGQRSPREWSLGPEPDPLADVPQAEGRRARRARIEATILAATHSLLEDRAASEVTISDLMGLVGLSRTAFYRYFPDVNSVLVRLLHEVQSEFIGTWLEAPYDADFKEVLAKDARSNMDRFQVHWSIIQACLDARTTAPDLYAAWVEVTDRIAERAGVRIAELNREGLSDVAHPMEMSRALVTFTIHYAMEGIQRLEREQLTSVADTLGDVWNRTIFCRS